MFDPARYGSFRDREAQHEQLAVNPRSTPSRVLGDHLKDQTPDLLGHGLSSHLPAHTRDQTPVQTETSTMPADHGLGSDYQECLLPGGPEAARENPEEPVQKAKPGPGMSALQNSQLLSKRQIFQQETLS